MSKLQKSIFIPLACCTLLLQSGCWSSVELNNRAFARLMILDQAESGIRLTLGFPLPSRVPAGKSGGGGSSSSEAFTFVTKTGTSIGDAYRKIQADMSRKITFGQLRMIVLGRKFAEDGMKPFVDLLSRGPSIHINGNLFVAEGEALRIAKVPVVFERFPVDILTSYVREHNTLGVTVKDLLVSVYSGGDIAIPMLVFGEEGAANEKNMQHWMGTNGAAIIREGRMVGTLNMMETRAAMWIMGDMIDAEFDVTSPIDGKTVSFIIEHPSAKVKPVVQGDQISFRIACRADARVISNESLIDVTDLKQVHRLEDKLNQSLGDRIDAAVSKAKQAGSDAFQFGDYVKWRYPGLWQKIRPNWRTTFVQEVKVSAQVNILINRFGAVRKPEWNRVLKEEGET
jgi:spore germination protein KC